MNILKRIFGKNGNNRNYIHDDDDDDEKEEEEGEDVVIIENFYEEDYKIKHLDDYIYPMTLYVDKCYYYKKNAHSTPIKIIHRCTSILKKYFKFDKDKKAIELSKKAWSTYYNKPKNEILLEWNVKRVIGSTGHTLFENLHSKIMYNWNTLKFTVHSEEESGMYTEESRNYSKEMLYYLSYKRNMKRLNFEEECFELRVSIPSMGLGGTMDCIYLNESTGERIIVDFKFSKNVEEYTGRFFIKNDDGNKKKLVMVKFSKINFNKILRLLSERNSYKKETYLKYILQIGIYDYMLRKRFGNIIKIKEHHIIVFGKKFKVYKINPMLSRDIVENLILSEYGANRVGSKFKNNYENDTLDNVDDFEKLEEVERFKSRDDILRTNIPTPLEEAQGFLTKRKRQTLLDDYNNQPKRRKLEKVNKKSNPTKKKRRVGNKKERKKNLKKGGNKRFTIGIKNVDEMNIIWEDKKRYDFFD